MIWQSASWGDRPWDEATPAKGCRDWRCPWARPYCGETSMSDLGKTHTHHESHTHIPFVPCQSALPFLRYGYLKILPWKSELTVMDEVKDQYEKLNFWRTRPKSDVPYMFYTKFYLDKPNFYSFSSKWTCIGKHYRKVSNIRRTEVGNTIVDHSDVDGASPVGAAPTTSSFST